MQKNRKIILTLIIIIVAQVLMPILSIIWQSEFTIFSVAATEYYINTAQDLWNFAAEVNNGNTFNGVTVYLTTDIDLGCSEDKQWNPIGYKEGEDTINYPATNFSGIFEGNNHYIEGIYISSEAKCQGLFGVVWGEINNLVLKNSTISVTNSYSNVGGIVAYLKSGASVNNCVNYATIYSEYSDANADQYGTIGGIVGNNYGGTINNCVNYGKITGYVAQLGGIAGCNRGTIYQCENYGKLDNLSTKVSYNGQGTGGITGCNYSTGEVLLCNNKATIEISGKGLTGGIVGNNFGGTISKCNNKENIISTIGPTVGGIVGDNWSNGEIESCINEGNLSGRGFVGGISGKITKASVINSINYGSLNNTMYAINGSSYLEESTGGIVGDISYGGTIKGSKNYGVIKINQTCSANTGTGGICGQAWGIDNEIYVLNNNNYADIFIESAIDHKVWNGGIIGTVIDGTVYVDKCRNYGNISGYGTYSGGIIGECGWNGSKAKISLCSNDGDISSDSKTTYVSVGGIIGQNTNGRIENSYNRGRLTGKSINAYYIGGLVGYNNFCGTDDVEININNSYNVGAVNGEGLSEIKCVGEIVGKNLIDDDSTSSYNVTNCYYLNGCTNNRYVNNNGTIQTISKKEEEMKNNTSFVELLNSNITDNIWVYDTENINDGYPIFVNEIEINEIAITIAPNKTTYIEGQNFDTTGMIVTATYNDGSTKEVTNYTVTDGTNLTAGKTSVTISYTEDGVTKTTTQEITVTAKALTGIAVTKAPDNVNYVAGQNFDPTGMVIEAIWNTGEEEETTNYTIINGDNLTCSQDKVEIQYNANSTIKTQVPITVTHSEVTDEAVAPTCTKTGLTEGQHCSLCNEVITVQQTIPSLGHSFTNYVSNNDSTCTKDGTKTAKCDRCEVTDTKADEGSKKPHTEVIDKAVEATCTETGLTEGKHCSVCNEVIKAQGTVPAKGHTEVIDKAIAPTCTEAGLTEGKHCSVCNTVITAQTTVPAKGHTEVIDEAVTPTCTETGLTEGKHCSVCNTVIKAQTTVPALGHSYENGECIRCGEEEPKVTVSSDEYEIDMSKLYITNIQSETTMENFKKKIDTTQGTEIKVYKDNVVVTDSSIIATGMVIKLKNGENKATFTLIVSGDVDKNGSVDFWDMIEINQHRLGIKPLDDVSITAGDVDETDNEFGFWDIIKINEYRLKKITRI
ncbi:MAG: bacterial Ig-like domain-containing protein [Clostridia bacterium]